MNDINSDSFDPNHYFNQIISNENIDDLLSINNRLIQGINNIKESHI